MNILEQIVAVKRREVARAKVRLPAAVLAGLPKPALRNFKRALSEGPGPNVIAEVKRASPSRGVLRPDDAPGQWQPEQLAQAYERGGAKALSVLTDVHFFWGHPDALLACKEATALPVLRKDFILDAYQIDESRWLGADAVLLIARLLTPGDMLALAERAQALGMDVLVEVHEPSELPAALQVPHAIIGVNNRDLDTLAIDVDRAARLRQQIPEDRVVVAESGLSQPEQLRRLCTLGVKAFLIGESVAKHNNPEAQLARLLRDTP